MPDTGGATSKKTKSKNQWRREKAKQKKLQSHEPVVAQSETVDQNLQQKSEPNGTSSNNLESENTRSQNGRLFESDIDAALNDPKFAQFKSILNKFYTEEGQAKTESNDVHMFLSDDEEGVSDDSDTKAKPDSKKISKSKLRVMRKIPLAELKALAPRPEVVEWFDADAPDPVLLVEIKSQKNLVPVPDHWMNKSEYLSTKRGIKKAPFDLPPFIKATGIMDMRDNTKEDEQTLRQKTRERVQPKMGKLDIDYQKLHDAFFKFQTKPRLYRVGEVYYEGKESEKDYSHFRPGKLSRKLVEALNIPSNAPPPWLLNMQRYGPPPSYPGLLIPGLNAPIPPGAQWGFQPGGYGKPPLDDNGTPLYGDPYGLTQPAQKVIRGLPTEKQLWGQPLPDESEEEEEEEEEEQEENTNDEGGYVDEDTAALADKYQEEHDENGAFELRKNSSSNNDGNKDSDYPAHDPNKKLFQVLEQKQSSSSGFMGRQMTYDIPVLGAEQKVSH